MRKLIRDKMARWGRINGKHVRFVKDQEEYDKLLLEKLKEEYDEFLDAIARGKDIAEIVGEAGDLVQVVGLLTVRYAMGADLNKVIEVMKNKTDYRGGFDAGVVLEDDE